MNFKRIVILGAVALIGLATPTAYAGFRHHHTNFVIGVGFSSFPYSGYGYYPYSYSYSSYRPTYGGQVAHRSIVVQVQERLSRADYYHGRIDGVMGSQTRSAIRAYQRARNIRVDGAIGDQLLGTMGLRY